MELSNRQTISIPLPSKRVSIIIVGIIVLALLVTGAISYIKSASIDAANVLNQQALNAITPYGGQLLQSDGKVLVQQGKSMAVVAWQDPSGQRHLSLAVDGILVSDRLVAGN